MARSIVVCFSALCGAADRVLRCIRKRGKCLECGVCTTLIMQSCNSPVPLSAPMLPRAQIEAVTRAWIAHEFPGLFDDVLFGNHWGLTGEKKTKAEMCLAEGACCLIDDSPKYIQQCAEVLDRAILFGTYPWNVGDDDAPLPANAQRANSWSDVVAALL
jgi:hypothetical protein